MKTLEQLRAEERQAWRDYNFLKTHESRKRWADAAVALNGAELIEKLNPSNVRAGKMQAAIEV